MQVIIHTLVDNICIVMLMHAAGGIRTGLGMLLIISISMASLFLPKKTALFFAAIATLSIIAQEIYSQLIYLDYSSEFTHVGLLGALIFSSAILTLHTAKQLEATETIAEEKSRELETVVQMNEHIIQHMRTGIIVIRNNGLILMANNAALELLGNNSLQVNSNIKDASIALYDRFIEWKSNSAANQKPIQQTQGLPDLQPGFSRIEQASQYNGEGRTLVFIEDATQLSQRFQQVKLASLGRLTASISHEIRNPLAAINHAGQLLGETSTDATDANLTNIINTQVRRLNGIVENVLQLSRQQPGTPEEIDLYQYLLKFRDEFIATQNLQVYQLPIKISPNNITIYFDANQLHQVMWNLFSNAINHSELESTNIRISVQGGIDKVSKLPYIDIIDNGPGIDESAQAYIFDPFFTTSSEGTGLGLYLTKEVLENNRAKIRHIPLPAGGTCFRLYFHQMRLQ